MRDAYRQRLYDAENRFCREAGLDRRVTLDEARDILALLSDDFAVAPPQVRARKMKSVGGYHEAGTITLDTVTRGGTAEYIAVHEFAHYLHWSRNIEYDGGHGPAFADLLVLVVAVYYGDQTGRHLRDVFARRNVPVGVAHVRAAKVKMAERRDRLRDREGETGTGWIIAVPVIAVPDVTPYDDETSTADRIYISETRKSSRKWFWTWQHTSAAVYRRRDTAEKWAEWVDHAAYIVKVEARFELVTPSTGAWYPLRIVD